MHSFDFIPKHHLTHSLAHSLRILLILRILQLAAMTKMADKSNFNLGQRSVACMVLAMMKMADNKFESVVRKRTSSISISAGKVLTITISIKATVTTEGQCHCG